MSIAAFLTSRQLIVGKLGGSRASGIEFGKWFTNVWTSTWGVLQPKISPQACERNSTAWTGEVITLPPPVSMTMGLGDSRCTHLHAPGMVCTNFFHWETLWFLAFVWIRRKRSVTSLVASPQAPRLMASRSAWGTDPVQINLLRRDVGTGRPWSCKKWASCSLRSNLRICLSARLCREPMRWAPESSLGLSAKVFSGRRSCNKPDLTSHCSASEAHILKAVSGSLRASLQRWFETATSFHSTGSGESWWEVFRGLANRMSGRPHLVTRRLKVVWAVEWSPPMHGSSWETAPWHRLSEAKMASMGCILALCLATAMQRPFRSLIRSKIGSESTFRLLSSARIHELGQSLSRKSMMLKMPSLPLSEWCR